MTIAPRRALRIIPPAEAPKESFPMAQNVSEIFEVEEASIACDGGGGALGHPKVYLNLEKEGFVECPYCSRRYVLKAGAHAVAGH